MTAGCNKTLNRSCKHIRIRVIWFCCVHNIYKVCKLLNLKNEQEFKYIKSFIDLKIRITFETCVVNRK